MKLAEAMAARRLLVLEPFVGWYQCRGLTGLYYYDTVFDREDEKDIKVQVRLGWFKRKWVPLSCLKEIKDALDWCSDGDPGPDERMTFTCSKCGDVI